LAITPARHLDPRDAEGDGGLKSARAQCARYPYGLIGASHVVAAEFATIAAANKHWR